MSATVPGEFATPLANSYWVKVGQLLAGEYPPGKDESRAAQRMQALLEAGVTRFIDLTAETELPAYISYLPERFGERAISHQRFTITDHDVPRDRQHMSEILDAIDVALDAGDCVYVHCHAGIGRTGTVIGCFLIRHGLSGAEALEVLNRLWLGCERSYTWPYVPETDAQRDFIANFKEADAEHPKLSLAQASRAEQYHGAMLGLLIGDVIGTLVGRDPIALTELQDSTADAVASRLSTMQWSSDAAMTLCIAESVLACGMNDAADQMRRYLSWQRQGTHTSDGRKIEVPATVQKALALWQWKHNPVAGSHDPAQIDAHVLARCTPLVLHLASTPVVALYEAAESARTTTQAPIAMDACRVFAAMLLAAVDGVSKADVCEFTSAQIFVELRAAPLKPELAKFVVGTERHADAAAGHDVISVLAAARNALATTQNFSDALFKVLRGAARPATAGAVCGALAGALYGVQGLPILWRETAPQASLWLNISTQLLTRAF